MYAGASRSAIEHHYDVAKAFYELWLDSSLTYSAALWGPDDTLEQAQVRKLDHLIHGARAANAGRVLDVGCGWGSLMRRLVTHHDVKRAVGLTLSQAQCDAIATWNDARCEVRVENWMSHQPDAPYDAIISIGAFEHFAKFGLTRAERIQSYRAFFSFCHRALRQDGRIALQTISKGSNVRLDRQTIDDMRFVCETIFPESELPWPAEILQAAEKSFEIVSLCNHAEHYARTCREWLARLQAHRPEAHEIVGERVTADYERYLASVIPQFEAGQVGLLRLVLQRT